MAASEKKARLLKLNNEMQHLITDLLGSSSPSSSDLSASEILKRGKNLQLRKKKKCQTSVVGQSLVPVTVSLMVKKGKLYVREGTPVEFTIDRQATYDELTLKVCEALELPETSKKRLLLTSGGAVIKQDSGWTLDKYMKQLHKGSIKLGIGDFEEVTASKGKTKLSEVTPRSSGYSTNDYDATTIVEKAVENTKDNPLTIEIEDDDRPVHPPEPKKPKILPGRESRQPAIKPVASECMEFCAKELSEASRNFSRNTVIGRGGYGTVFKGRLRYSTVAIKVLSPEGKAAFFRLKSTEQFKTEVSTLNRFRHPNILQLFGYCSKPAALVFEYMTNGSLHQKLHEERSAYLTWDRRKSIILDSCRGIVYLHTANPPTVHQDIKSANILLDENFRAKLGDFGFAIELPRISGGRTMFTSEFIVRTEGYYPPEVSMGKYSDRSDVYSFGVVVLEVWTGLTAYDSRRKDPKLVEYLEDDLKKEESFEKTFDGCLKRPILMEDVAKNYFDIVTSCFRKHSTRPTAVEVLELLE